MVGGLPTDGKAEPRMNTFGACCFEMKTVNLRSISLSKGPWSRTDPPAVCPQFGFAIRGNCQSPAYGRTVPKTIQFFDGYDHPGSRFQQGRTLPKSGSYFGTIPKLSGPNVGDFWQC